MVQFKAFIPLVGNLLYERAAIFMAPNSLNN
jgi:hypothetical protein